MFSSLKGPTENCTQHPHRECCTNSSQGVVVAVSWGSVETRLQICICSDRLRGNVSACKCVSVRRVCGVFWSSSFFFFSFVPNSDDNCFWGCKHYVCSPVSRTKLLLFKKRKKKPLTLWFYVAFVIISLESPSKPQVGVYTTHLAVRSPFCSEGIVTTFAFIYPQRHLYGDFEYSSFVLSTASIAHRDRWKRESACTSRVWGCVCVFKKNILSIPLLSPQCPPSRGDSGGERGQWDRHRGLLATPSRGGAERGGPGVQGNKKNSQTPPRVSASWTVVVETRAGMPTEQRTEKETMRRHGKVMNSWSRRTFVHSPVLWWQTLSDKRGKESKTRGAVGNCCDAMPSGGECRPTHVVSVQKVYNGEKYLW